MITEEHKNRYNKPLLISITTDIDEHNKFVVIIHIYFQLPIEYRIANELVTCSAITFVASSFVILSVFSFDIILDINNVKQAAAST